MKYKPYTLDELKQAVKESFTFSDVCRKLGRATNSGTLHSIKEHIEEAKLDTSHFKGHGFGRNNNDKVYYTLDEALTENSTYKNTNRLKNRLFKEGYKEERCEICGINEWMGKKITLQLHHKNGIRNDNRIENLQILCPNCHTQTDNYGSRNINNNVRVSEW